MTFINVPTNFVATIATNTQGIFSDLLPIAVVVIGVSLGVFVLNWAISKFKTRGETDVKKTSVEYSKTFMDAVNTTGKDITGRKHYEGDID